MQLNGARCTRHTKAGCQGVIPLCLGHAGRLCCCCCVVKALQINHSHYTSNTEAGGWIIPRPFSLILCDPVPISHCVREHSALLFCAMKEWRTKGVLSLLCRVSFSLPWMCFIWSICWACEGGSICRPESVDSWVSRFRLRPLRINLKTHLYLYVLVFHPHWDCKNWASWRPSFPSGYIWKHCFCIVHLYCHSYCTHAYWWLYWQCCAWYSLQ